jgi:hypothetical protein
LLAQELNQRVSSKAPAEATSARVFERMAPTDLQTFAASAEHIAFVFALYALIMLFLLVVLAGVLPAPKAQERPSSVDGRRSRFAPGLIGYGIAQALAPWLVCRGRWDDTRRYGVQPRPATGRQPAMRAASAHRRGSIAHWRSMLTIRRRAKSSRNRTRGARRELRSHDQTIANVW